MGGRVFEEPGVGCEDAIPATEFFAGSACDGAAVGVTVEDEGAGTGAVLAGGWAGRVATAG